MKRLLLLALLLGVPSLASAQALPGDSYGFDYPTASIGLVERFEMQIDAAAWVDVEIPPVQNDAQTTAGHDTYVTPIPALAPGDYVVMARACNAGGCSAPGAQLAFTMQVFESPINGRVVRGGSGDVPEDD